MVPPPSMPGPRSDENSSASEATAMMSACALSTQNPVPSGVWAVAGCHHTGASRRSLVNTWSGNPSVNNSRSVRSVSSSCTFTAGRRSCERTGSGMGHRLGAARFVELGTGQVAEGKSRFAQRGPLLVGLLGHLGRLVVADERVEGGDHQQRVLEGRADPGLVW